MSPKNKGFARLTLWLAIGALFVPVVSCSPDAKPVHPNVLLISIDTLRADRLGCYGYTKPTSPILDALAKGKDSILFEQCYAQAPNTAPSHMTLLTSLYPTAHAVPNITPKPGTPGRRHATPRGPCRSS
ncbi:MAG: sulfatase-like hydrolase/transferase [Planctomycetota bacterium]